MLDLLDSKCGGAACTALRGAINNNLLAIRKLSDAAEDDDFKNFSFCMEMMQKELHVANLLYEELQNYLASHISPGD